MDIERTWFLSCKQLGEIDITVETCRPDPSKLDMVWVRATSGKYEWKYAVFSDGFEHSGWAPITGAHTLEQAKAAALVLFRMRG